MNPFMPCRSTRYKFQHDGAPVHQSRSTRNWLTSKSIRLLNGGVWPPNSPDMNPIEHVWPIVARMLEGKIFANADALWQALSAAFGQIKRSQILKLYDSMPRRLEALRLAKGGSTRY